MSDISSNIIIVILVTSFATYLSRFLGVVSSEKIKDTSKIFKWFNCIFYQQVRNKESRLIELKLPEQLFLRLKFFLYGQVY